MWTSLALILGLSVGSFINAALYRIKNDRPWTHGRSFCPSCKHTLAWWQLVPVVSFFILGRRCYNCQKPISWQYPIVELLTGLLFALQVWLKPDFLQQPAILLINLGFIALLIFIAIYDLKHYLIIDGAVITGIILALAASLISGTILIDALSAIGLFVFFGGIYLFSKGEWLGFGDVKLALFLGLVSGPLIFITVTLASWIGLLIGLYLIALRGGSLKTQLPFGTLLAGGAILVLIFEPYILSFLNTYFYF